MKNILIASTVALGFLAAPAATFAQDTTMGDEIVKPKKSKDWFVYADANFAAAQFSTSDGNTTSVSDSTTAAYFRAGVKYKYFGAEVELGQGLSDIEEDGLSLEVSSQKSVFGILRAPGDQYDVFIRAGYHSSTLNISGQFVDPNTGNLLNASEDLKSDGFVAGVGGTYYFTDNFGVRADVTGYNMRDLVDASFVAGSIGVSVKF